MNSTKMANKEDSNNNPENRSRKNPESIEKNEALFLSPRFRSAAAMAGWDEESLLAASLTVDDTPDCESKQKKRSILRNLKTPPSNSRSRKRRTQRRSPSSVPIANLDLEELNDSTSKQDEIKVELNDAVKVEKVEVKTKESAVPTASTAIPCIDRLREELSCAICLDICYEPSTTPCGHSFCKKCLRSAADKCGKKCPKCRQIISNWRNCTVNTVLWNTIQLLFPQEVEARKSASTSSDLESHQEPVVPTRQNTRRYHSIQALNSPDSEPRNRERRIHHRIRTRGPQPSGNRGVVDVNVERELARGQNDDSALALRLQREEFMEAFRVTTDNRNRNASFTYMGSVGGRMVSGNSNRNSSSTSMGTVNGRIVSTDRNRNSSFTSARANLRAMASRVMSSRGI